MSEKNIVASPRPKMMRGPGRGIGMPGEKAKDFSGTLKRLVKYLSPYKFSIIFIFVLAIFSTAFSIVGPKILGNAITMLFQGLENKIKGVSSSSIDFVSLGKTLIFLLCLYIISSVFSFISQISMAKISQKTVYSFRKAIDEKLDRLPLKFFDKQTHGEILSRVTNDVDTIANTLQQSLIQIVNSIVTLIGSIIMMFSISWQLTLVALATLPLYILTAGLVAKHSQKYFKAQQKTLGELNGHIEEMYSGHQVVKAFCYENRSVEEFNKTNDKLYTVSWKAQFVSGSLMPVMNFLNNLGYVLIAAIGGIMTASRLISIGDVQAFIQYARQFTQPIIQTATIANTLQSTMAASERVFEILDEEEESEDPKLSPELQEKVQKLQGTVSFNHIKFGYNEDNILIKDLNLEVEKGKTIAIVGPTGAGKTTLVNLLLRFYELNGGNISIDGINIKDMPRGILRRNTGMVLQDTWLFNGTIRDNIAYGKPDASDEEIRAASIAAQADHFIRVLPDGYNTILNEEASNISQGQRQLLTIARAFLTNPKILILDEATSSVDTRTEVVVRKAMEKLMENRTSFVIAHRLSTIRDANTILVMNNGSIIETGNHDTLIAAKGFYADLYNSQFAGTNL